MLKQHERFLRTSGYDAQFDLELVEREVARKDEGKYQIVLVPRG
jgi:hypothetical protein